MDHADAPPNGRDTGTGLPETPHQLPIDRAKVDALVARVRDGEEIDLLDEFLAVVDWRVGFGGTDGDELALDDIARLIAYYRAKFADVGAFYFAELLSTEFMTEQRARGDVDFSPRLLELGRNDPQLWQEIRQFFRRKELATAMLVAANRGRLASAAE